VGTYSSPESRKSDGRTVSLAAATSYRCRPTGNITETHRVNGIEKNEAVLATSNKSPDGPDDPVSPTPVVHSDYFDEVSGQSLRHGFRFKHRFSTTSR